LLFNTQKVHQPKTINYEQYFGVTLAITPATARVGLSVAIFFPTPFQPQKKDFHYYPSRITFQTKTTFAKIED